MYDMPCMVAFYVLVDQNRKHIYILHYKILRTIKSIGTHSSTIASLEKNGFVTIDYDIWCTKNSKKVRVIQETPRQMVQQKPSTSPSMYLMVQQRRPSTLCLLNQSQSQSNLNEMKTCSKCNHFTISLCFHRRHLDSEESAQTFNAAFHISMLIQR